jgi:hypothetical protein
MERTRCESMTATCGLGKGNGLKHEQLDETRGPRDRSHDPRLPDAGDEQ